MAESIPRNAPCPCGSGKKYKHCHLGKDFEEVKRKKEIGVIIVFVLGIVLGIVAWQIRDDFGLGAGVAIGVIVLDSMVFVFRDPPPPNANSGDPAGLNFGN